MNEIDQLCRNFDDWIARAKDEAESVYAQRNTPKGGLVAIRHGRYNDRRPGPEAAGATRASARIERRGDALEHELEAELAKLTPRQRAIAEARWALDTPLN